MEPADLNSSSAANDDARLYALLRDRVAPLPDDGFSARVVAALPAATLRPVWSRRMGFCIAGTLAGSALVLSQSGSLGEIRVGTEQVLTNLGATLAALSDPTFVLAIVVAVLSLLVAFQAELRRKLLA